MSKVVDTGGPAYPFIGRTSDDESWFNEGVTVRDYFAGKALAGMLASGMLRMPVSEASKDYVAEECYKYSDAMLRSRGS